MRLIANKTERRNGFTTLELLVASMLGSIVLLGLHSFTQTQLKSLQSQAVQLNVQSTARSVLEVIARDIRRGGLDPTCAKTFEGLAVAKTNELRLLSDLDGSGAIDSGEEDITYRYNYYNNSVERVSANATPSSLMQNVDTSGSTVRYFDGAGNELLPGSIGLTAGQRALVRRVRIELALSEPGRAFGQRMRAQVASDVDMRNRYFLADTRCP